MGAYYANRHGLDVVSLRIGWLLTRDELREVCRPRRRWRAVRPRDVAQPEDCRRVVEAAATHSLRRTPLIAHGISDNAERFLSLSETMLELGYRPQDDSQTVLEDEVNGRTGLETG